MGIKLKGLSIAASLNLPNAYVRVDRVSGGKQDGYWSFNLGLYIDKDAASATSETSPVARYGGSIPYADGNPIKQTYDYLKANNNERLKGMLNLTYTESIDD